MSSISSRRSWDTAVKHLVRYDVLHDVLNSDQITKIPQSVSVYNEIRPQMSLGGNTPEETFNGIAIDISQYTQHFNEQKALRRQLNKENACKVCL